MRIPHSVDSLSINRMVPDLVAQETFLLAFLPPRRIGDIVASSSLASLPWRSAPNMYDEEAPVSIVTGFLLCCLILMDVPSPWLRGPVHMYFLHYSNRSLSI